MIAQRQQPLHGAKLVERLLEEARRAGADAG